MLNFADNGYTQPSSYYEYATHPPDDMRQIVFQGRLPEGWVKITQFTDRRTGQTLFKGIYLVYGKWGDLGYPCRLYATSDGENWGFKTEFRWASVIYDQVPDSDPHYIWQEVITSFNIWLNNLITAMKGKQNERT